MKVLARFFLIIALVVPGTNSFSQIFKPLPKGLGIEIGGGQNNLFWSAHPGIETIGAGPIDRTQLVLTPNIRINYIIQLNSIFTAMVFTGYNRFGGSSNFEDGHQSKYYFNAIECGSFFLFSISNFRIGIGLKANYHLNVQFDFNTSSYTYNENRSDWFKNWSGNAGIRSMYVLLPFSISLEVWLGLNDLRNTHIILPGGVIRENHFRLLFGYIL